MPDSLCVLFCGGLKRIDPRVDAGCTQCAIDLPTTCSKGWHNQPS
jgi:hypothetical protein